MPLFTLFENPFQGDGDMDRWSFAHSLDHQQIQQGIQLVFSVKIVKRVLYPVSREDLDVFLLNHQQTHNDMNQYLGLDGKDLETSFDPRDPQALQDWVWQDYQEHKAARAALGI